MKIQIVYKKFRTHITKYKTLTSNNHYFNGTVVILNEKNFKSNKLTKTDHQRVTTNEIK